MWSVCVLYCKLGAAYSTLLGSSLACSLTAHRCLVEFDIILIEIERKLGMKVI